MDDSVNVQFTVIVPYAIAASLDIYPGPDTTVMRDSALAAARTYAETQHRIGYDVTRSGLYATLHQPGVIRMHLNEPSSFLRGLHALHIMGSTFPNRVRDL